MRGTIAVVALTLLAGPGAAQESEREPVVDFETLLLELGDRDRLAIFPGADYTQHQASSHDPRNGAGFSRLGAPWGFANVDFGNYLGQVTIQGREEWVLLDEVGPGALTRWWSVGIDDDLLAQGSFRVYLDGSEEPVIQKSAVDLLGADRSGFGPALNFGTPERGGNLYAPVPFRSRVLVTWDGPTTHGGKDVASRDPSLEHSAEAALWYNINFRRFGAGREVVSLRSGDAAAHRETLEALGHALAEPGPVGAPGESLIERGRLAPGDRLVHEIPGPGAIRFLKVNVEGADTVAALRDVALVLAFDGQQTARLPVGQFFGNGLSEGPENPLNEGGDYLRQVGPGGDLTSRWVMPFAEGAEVALENGGRDAVDAHLEVVRGPWEWDERSMHFHADYRHEEGIRSQSAGDAAWPGVAGKRELYSAEGDGDFRFVDIRGAGVYVGDTFSVRNRSTGPGLNTWWGEGDEKIYVDYLADGDGSRSVPQHLGTGTEDYYGYSFGSGKEFQSLFVTQPLAAGNRTDDGALTVNGRVRGLDAIPFHHSFKFDMELWKWREGFLEVGAATFWYGRPGATALHTVADLSVDLAREADRRKAATVGVTDTAGDGRWLFLSSDDPDPDAPEARLANLLWGPVGDRGTRGLRAEEGAGTVAPSLAETFIFEAGRQNVPGSTSHPGYHEVLVQPGSGDGACPYVVVRWVAGPSSAGLINVSGVVRNLVEGGDGPDFTVRVGGELVFEASTSRADGVLEETYFELDRRIEEGEIVDFVLGNGDRGDAQGDESALRVVIRGAGSGAR